MIVVTVSCKFGSKYRKENCHHDHIPFDLKLNVNIFGSQGTYFVSVFTLPENIHRTNASFQIIYLSMKEIKNHLLMQQEQIYNISNIV